MCVAGPACCTSSGRGADPAQPSAAHVPELDALRRPGEHAPGPCASPLATHMGEPQPLPTVPGPCAQAACGRRPGCMMCAAHEAPSEQRAGLQAVWLADNAVPLLAAPLGAALPDPASPQLRSLGCTRSRLGPAAAACSSWEQPAVAACPCRMCKARASAWLPCPGAGRLPGLQAGHGRAHPQRLHDHV